MDRNLAATPDSRAEGRREADTMAVKVLFFARCSDWMKRKEIEISVGQEMSLTRLIESTPELSPITEHLDLLNVAVNSEIVALDFVVRDGDEVAFLPPLSGG